MVVFSESASAFAIKAVTGRPRFLRLGSVTAPGVLLCSCLHAF